VFNAPGVVEDGRGRPPSRLSRLNFPHDTLWLACFADDPDATQSKQWYAASNDESEIAMYYDTWMKSHIEGIGVNGDGGNSTSRRRIAPRRHGDGGQWRVPRRTRVLHQVRRDLDARSMGRSGLHPETELNGRATAFARKQPRTKTAANSPRKERS
jgi:hypothetical protein